MVLQLSQRQRWGDSTFEAVKLANAGKIRNFESEKAGTNLNFDSKEPYLISFVHC